MAKFMLSAGHSSKCIGASGNGYKEHVEATKIMLKVAEYLKQLGATVVTFEDTYSKNQSDNLTKITNKHNATTRDYDVSFHLNSSGDPTATGAEAFYHSGTNMQKMSANVSKAIADTLGIKNRGAKQNQGLYFLRKTTKPAILIEICFISNKNDMAKYVANFDKMCKAIAYALVGKTMPKETVPTKTTTTTTTTTNAVYRLVSGTFATKADADACHKKLMTLMKVAYVNQEGTRYRITTGTFANEASAKDMITKIKKLTGFTFNLKAEGTAKPKVVVDDNLILGTPQLTATKLKNFVVKTVGEQTDLAELAKQYITIGKKYGIRGDIAFCQAILETGWFKYTGGTAVTPNQHNYCGLGVTKKGVKGCEFATVAEGVTAHIQHLYAYACTKEVPKGETIIDPRFKYVKRGVAPTWNDLSNKWAMNANYGKQILELYNKVK